MKSIQIVLLILLTGVLFSCGFSANQRVIVIQPLGNMPVATVNLVWKQLKQVSPHVILNDAIPLPAFAYYRPRDRYRADSMISYLNHNGKDTIIVGITNRDISIAKGKITDWGIMGLGLTPGNACVVSTFRLPQKNRMAQLYKLTLHELGHTQGLSHCTNKYCLMRDAEGSNHFDETPGFCANCKALLKSKGVYQQ